MDMEGVGATRPAGSKRPRRAKGARRSSPAETPVSTLWVPFLARPAGLGRTRYIRRHIPVADGTSTEKRTTMTVVGPIASAFPRCAMDGRHLRDSVITRQWTRAAGCRESGFVP
jgi:hypothetical protein